MPRPPSHRYRCDNCGYSHDGGRKCDTHIVLAVDAMRPLSGGDRRIVLQRLGACLNCFDDDCSGHCVDLPGEDN